MEECKFTLFQLILSFVIGLIVSCSSASFIILLFALIIFEIYHFSRTWKKSKWIPFCRTGFISAYILGWIVGRSVHKLDTHLVCKKFDAQNNMCFWK